MVRLKIGNVFKVATSNGICLFQYAYKDERIGSLIRILPNLYKDEFVEEKELYLIHFPLGAALRQKIVTKVGNYPIPQNFILPRKFRTEHVIRDEFDLDGVTNDK